MNSTLDNNENIFDFMGFRLANRYDELLKEEGEDKEIHVVPIAKVKDEFNDLKSGQIILMGVLGKRKDSENNLTGIAGIIAHIEDNIKHLSRNIKLPFTKNS
ncbi:hypothetical protein DdX_15529 [Ditylenchus destructor]|uniref:Uncharacterized protein n=1 Tax=Ditylenchus destructor TaxID=166010 RepID=A0AAD4R0Q4_9BILA|nr:hypothetical protein DdX_15529 [Ditylenchus destructor]